MRRNWLEILCCRKIRTYKRHTSKLREDKDKPWEATMLLVIYLLFVVIYLSLITQVLTPIVLDLCMYK